MKTDRQPAAFVLVHGGFSGGWCWQRVGERLTAAGHLVFTPTLSGLAERADELSAEVNLTAHIDEIVALVQGENLTDFVLCGHSYGGMVISGTADRLVTSIRAMVYLDAVLPEPGACLWDYMADDQRRHFQNATSGLVIATGRPGPSIVNAADADWVASMSTPHPVATLHQPLPAAARPQAGGGNIHVRATGYPSTMLDDSHRRAAAMGWTCIELPYAHNVMLDAPAEVCEILQAAAR